MDVFIIVIKNAFVSKKRVNDRRWKRLKDTIFSFALSSTSNITNHANYSQKKYFHFTNSLWVLANDPFDKYDEAKRQRMCKCFISAFFRVSETNLFIFHLHLKRTLCPSRRKIVNRKDKLLLPFAPISRPSAHSMNDTRDCLHFFWENDLWECRSCVCLSFFIGW